MLQDRELIANKLIVGMTTTKAAAMQPLLKSLKPSIGEIVHLFYCSNFGSKCV